MLGGRGVSDKLAAARMKVDEYEKLGKLDELKAVKDSVATLTTERDAARVESVNLRRQIEELNAKLSAGGVIAAIPPRAGGAARPPSVTPSKSSEIRIDRIDPDVLKRIRERRSKR
jgi:molybdopterin converting factor small subunit